MDFYSFAPVAAVLDLAYAGVTALIDFFTPLAGSFAAALAVVALTLIVRTALIPVGRSQVRAEFTRRRLAPRLQAISRKYRDKPELLQQKTLALYKEENASPFAGIGPALLQAPVVSIVYGLFIVASINGHPNDLLGHELFGVSLGTSLLAQLAAPDILPGALVFAVLLTVIAVVAAVSRIVALRFTANQPVDATAPGAERMKLLGAWLSWLPFLTVLFAGVVPLAATLYLTVTTTWTLVERSILRRVLAPKDAGVQV
ncbi:membrane protein insertase YidC [Glaciihabitans arcticus]|uniref:Membrane protein insertase YidC n=2 Tax=Glaciihabitans arcticus TaxID=2668039 RepID=A0A4Q9GU19_9MICO|nr:membrane protein insertase YidC [Glaciihabitans arcticus]